MDRNAISGSQALNIKLTTKDGFESERQQVNNKLIIIVGSLEKGMTEDEMVGWHNSLNGQGFRWVPGVDDG